MTKKVINLLIIEDCPFTIQGYKTVLETTFNLIFNITSASNCDEAILLIKSRRFTLVLLDLQLPISKDEKYIGGEDLGLLIRKTQKNTEIIVLTNITEALRVNNIVNEIKPNGFIIKSHSNTRDLIIAIKTVLQGKTYFCNTTKDLIRKTINGITMDDFDRQILYHLSMGEKTKDICNYVPLSLRAIEVRKSKLKASFTNKEGADKNLVKEAKKLGVI